MIQIARRLGAAALLLTVLIAARGQQPQHSPLDDLGPALNSPECVHIPDAKGEQEGDEVLGVGRNGEFCAYPLRMMTHHRIVNDHLGGPPILVAYDPLSGASEVYDPIMDGKPLNFDAAGTRNGVPLLQDRETKTYWSQLSGAAVEGTLSGKQLARIPSLILTWKLWGRLHSDSWVLKEDAKQSAHYVSRVTPVSFAIPPTLKQSLPKRPDRRLPSDKLVFGVVSGLKSRAYSLDQLEKNRGVVSTKLDSAAIVIFSDPSNHAAAAFETKDDFETRDLNGIRSFHDRTSGIDYSIEGKPVKGDPLKPVAFTRCRWYAWSSVYPKTELARLKIASSPVNTFRGALVQPAGFDSRSARKLKQDGYNSVVFDLTSASANSEPALASGRAAGLKVYGWIQVGRDEAAAKAHPEWMHSPQHSEWLQGSGLKQAVVYPWVCVNNRAVFDYERARVRRLIPNIKELSGLFLSDIQGPPNGCGCGNILCRSWDNSPGPKIAAAPYNHPDVYFSQVFLKAVQDDMPGLSVYPVLCEECENGLDIGIAHNPDAESGACHGIPCSHPCSLDYYPGLVRSLSGSQPVGLLLPYKLFHRDTARYGNEAAWITGAMGRLHNIEPTQPVIAILQGWDVTPEQKAQQIKQVGVESGYLIALTPIDQSWRAVKAGSRE